MLLAQLIGDGRGARQPLAAPTTTGLAAANPIRRRPCARAAAGTTVRLPAPFHLTTAGTTRIAGWLDELGLFGLRSHEKFVPDPVFALPDEQLALFLRRLWATDGSVRWDQRARRGEVGFASTSRAAGATTWPGCCCASASSAGSSAPARRFPGLLAAAHHRLRAPAGVPARGRGASRRTSRPADGSTGELQEIADGTDLDTIPNDGVGAGPEGAGRAPDDASRPRRGAGLPVLRPRSAGGMPRAGPGWRASHVLAGRASWS